MHDLARILSVMGGVSQETKATLDSADLLPDGPGHQGCLVFTGTYLKQHPSCTKTRSSERSFRSRTRGMRHAHTRHL